MITIREFITAVITYRISRQNIMGRTPFYAVSVNYLYGVRVRACRPDSSGNLSTRRKMEFAQYNVYINTNPTINKLKKKMGK